MTNTMTALMVAVGGTSLVCYWLMKRVQNGPARHRSAASDNSNYGIGSGSTYDSGGGWNVLTWFNSDSSSSDNSGVSDSSGSCDSGGGDAVAAATAEVVAIRIVVSAEGVLCL